MKPYKNHTQAILHISTIYIYIYIYIVIERTVYTVLFSKQLDIIFITRFLLLVLDTFIIFCKCIDDVFHKRWFQRQIYTTYNRISLKSNIKTYSPLICVCMVPCSWDPGSSVWGRSPPRPLVYRGNHGMPPRPATEPRVKWAADHTS